jgi:hypothetical protein
MLHGGDWQVRSWAFSRWTVDVSVSACSGLVSSEVGVVDLRGQHLIGFGFHTTRDSLASAV